MKSLSDYTGAKQTQLFTQYGAFFAFSKKQFDEQAKKDIDYRAMGAGLICPVDHCALLFSALNNLNQAGIQQDLEENGKDKIIDRELANYECYWTYDLEHCIEALDDYPISKEEIRAVFNLNISKHENDY